MNKLANEYEVISKRAGFSDITAEFARVRVSGENRAAFIHGQCTNEIRKMLTGESCFAAFLTPKGKMRGVAHIICLDNNFLLDYSNTLSPLLESSLNKYIITEDVIIENASEELGELTVQGSHAVDVVEKLKNLGAVVYNNQLAKTSGFNVIVSISRIDELMNICITNGAKRVSSELLEVLRVEAGSPKWGVDMDENTIPIEAGLAKSAISYDKGCYIGQETIARIKTYGHVNRYLVQLGLEGDRLPRRGERIRDDHNDIGYVTSCVKSIHLGQGLALGYVKRDQAIIGNRLGIGNQTAEVLKLCSV